MSMSMMQDPRALWVHIEITPECGPVKYEYDAQLGLVVDRIMRMPMHYPVPYGYAPKTRCDDGDALDVLVMVPTPVMPTAWICVRPVAVLLMEDEKGGDEKILAVPISSVSHYYDTVLDVDDVPIYVLDSISSFFSRYKDLDQNKWSRVTGWRGVDEAVSLIERAMNQYQGSVE